MSTRQKSQHAFWVFYAHIRITQLNNLFATRLNTQLDCYVSWKPDPAPKRIDAFSITWNGIFVYVFPQVFKEVGERPTFGIVCCAMQ